VDLAKQVYCENKDVFAKQKIKMFAWLLLSDRRNTKDMIQRRYGQATDNYSLLPKLHCIQSLVKVKFCEV
jgi:hypothetical protein